MVAQPGLCQTWSENAKTAFVLTRLIFDMMGKEIADSPSFIKFETEEQDVEKLKEKFERA